MFEKNKCRSLSDLFIGEMVNLNSSYYQESQSINSLTSCGLKMILRLEDDFVSKYKLYKEIFTGTYYKTYSSEYSCDGDIIVRKVSPIISYCTNEELLKNKISTVRLIEIYKDINKKEITAEISLLK